MVAGLAGALLLGRSAPAAAGSGALIAVLHPVAQDTGKVDESVNLGTARFTQGKDKVDVLVQVNGVSTAGSEATQGADGEGAYYKHGIHIHEGGACGPTEKDGATVPAGAAGPHFDPGKTGSHKGPEGNGHAGDLPNLHVLSDGTGILMASTTRLTMDQLAGKTVILHANPDNYTDQPANGGSGSRIACGVIKAE
jgi:Cu/Zn superoxide dismutase